MKKTLIFGHKKPDTDAVMSAIGLAVHVNKNKKKRERERKQKLQSIFDYFDDDYDNGGFESSFDDDFDDNSFDFRK